MMPSSNASLTITDNDKNIDYTFPLYMSENSEAREISFDIHSHQVGSDIRLQPNRTYSFRLPLFPLTGGLGQNRIAPRPKTYAKANGDARYENLFVPPPLHTAITLANGNAPFLITEFNSLLFVIGGRYVYTIDPTNHTASQDKDLTVGKAATWATAYNNELIVGMGESEKIWKRDTSAVWTQATDATYATQLAVVDEKLWRAKGTNNVSSCITTPLTLANWSADYPVGDSTYAINCIVDYQGAVWVGKPDGMYLGDPTGKFHNQTPQLRQWPHADNCKGAFVAKGSLWVPSAAGLIRIRMGESKPKGPEITFRPDYRFWVRDGVEFGGQIYLLCTDQASSSPENTCIVLMVEDPNSKGEFFYHEWCRLGGSTKGYAVTATTKSTVPELYLTYGNDTKYISLALGGGRDIDDTLHVFGTSSYLETGRIAPSIGEGSLDWDDLGLLATAQGVEVVCKLRTGDSYTVQVKPDGGSWQTLKDNQESGPNTTAITGPTTNYQRFIRYLDPESCSGNFFEVNWTGTLAAGSGTDRAEIVAAYLFGYIRPIHADLLSISVILDGSQWTGNSMSGGISAMDAHTVLTRWLLSGTPLTFKLQEYQENKTTRGIITYFKLDEISSDIDAGPRAQPVYKAQIYLIRVPFGPDWGEL